MNTRSDDADLPATSAPLREKVAAWLNAEGYPTEFMTANAFRRLGFQVHQGDYVADSEEGNKREIDVLADLSTIGRNKTIIRVTHLIECKWSTDKPWVVFTSPSTRMAPSARVSQTIGSQLGEAIIWTMAGDEALHKMHSFATPSEGGFGGRQVFSKGQDVFYSAIQSVVANSQSYAASYDRVPRKEGVMPKAAVLVFPVLVVEGDLFRAYFEQDRNCLEVENAGHIRCHWQGASSRIPLITVDVVTTKCLANFAATRRQEAEQLLEIMSTTAGKISECFAKRNVKSLAVTSGPRGTVGPPRLLGELLKPKSGSKRMGRAKQ